MVIAFQWQYIEPILGIEYFYEKMVAISWLLVGFYFLCTADNIVSRIFMVATFNNILDEFLFNPLVFGINEKILGIVIFILLITEFNHPKKLSRNAE